jgi:ABC-type phosphate transport system permease subunit
VETNPAEAGYLGQRAAIRTLPASLTARKIRERIIESVMFLCALSSIAITLGIVGILLFEFW